MDQAIDTQRAIYARAMWAYAGALETADKLTGPETPITLVDTHTLGTLQIARRLLKDGAPHHFTLLAPRLSSRTPCLRCKGPVEGIIDTVWHLKYVHGHSFPEISSALRRVAVEIIPELASLEVLERG